MSFFFSVPADHWENTSWQDLILFYSYTPANTFVAAFHFTIALLPAGPLLLTHPPVWYKPELVKTEKAFEDEELKPLLGKKLREDKKAAKKKAKAEGAAEKDDDEE